MRAEEYAALTVAEVEEALSTTTSNGLSAEQYEKQSSNAPRHAVLPERRVSLGGFIALTMRRLSPLLMLFAIVWAALSGRVTLAVIALGFYAAFLLLLFLFYAYRETALGQKEALACPKVTVIRDGRPLKLSPEELVLGDLLLLEPGSVLFATARVLLSDGLTVWTEVGQHRYTMTKNAEVVSGNVKIKPNMLHQGDIVRQGSGRAVVVETAERPIKPPSFDEYLPEKWCQIGQMVTRVGLALLFLALVLRFFLGAQDSFSLFMLMGASLVAMSPVEWLPLLLAVVFLSKNRLLLRRRGAFLTSPEAAEKLAGADLYVLSSRSVFRNDCHRVRSFMTSDGKVLSASSVKTNKELTVIATCLLAVRDKKVLEQEKHLYRFCSRHASDLPLKRIFMSAAEGGACSIASFCVPGQNRGLTLIGGTPEALLPHVMYASEDGRVHVLDPATKQAMLEQAERLQRNGFRVVAYAESQVMREASPLSERKDMKLLGFFVLSSLPDRETEKSISALKKQGKKLLLLHEGDDPSPVLAALHADEVAKINSDTDWETPLMAFAKDLTQSIGVLCSFDGMKKAQALRLLSGEGYCVAAVGEDFSEHRMVCAAAVPGSIAPEQAEEANPAVYAAAAFFAPARLGAFWDTVQTSCSMTASLGVLTVLLSVTWVLRAAVCLAGILFGQAVLSLLFLLLLSVAVDLPAVFCVSYTPFSPRVEKDMPLMLRQCQPRAFLSGALAAAVYVGCFALYITLHPESFHFNANGFLLLVVLSLANFIFFSYEKASFSVMSFLFPLYSLMLPAFFLYLGFRSMVGGIPYSAVLLFWALVPVVVFSLVRRTVEAVWMNRQMPPSVGRIPQL